MSYSSQY